MAFNAIEVVDRQAIANDPDADFQSWKGIASDGNSLRFTRMRSAQRRSWCSIGSANQLVRLTQGLSIASNFADFGDTVISTNHTPGQSFIIDFDHPVTGVGLDVEPLPDGANLGQPYKIRLQISNIATGDSFLAEILANTGASGFIGARCDADVIDHMLVKVVMIGAGGIETPVDFAVNRLELITPIGNIV